MTAVEWYEQEVSRLDLMMAGGSISLGEYVKLKQKALEQAKEMEEKIIAQAFEDGDYNYFYSKKTGKEFESGIEYYNEKFKSE